MKFTNILLCLGACMITLAFGQEAGFLNATSAEVANVTAANATTEGIVAAGAANMTNETAAGAGNMTRNQTIVKADDPILLFLNKSDMFPSAENFVESNFNKTSIVMLEEDQIVKITTWLYNNQSDNTMLTIVKTEMQDLVVE